MQCVANESIIYLLVPLLVLICAELFYHISYVCCIWVWVVPWGRWAWIKHAFALAFVLWVLCGFVVQELSNMMCWHACHMCLSGVLDVFCGAMLSKWRGCILRNYIGRMIYHVWLVGTLTLWIWSALIWWVRTSSFKFSTSNFICVNKKLLRITMAPWCKPLCADSG